MIRWSTLLCLAGFGCSGGGDDASQGADAVATPSTGPGTPALDVNDPAPEPGPPAEALGLIADAYGAHRVRCPIGGAGTVKVVDGSPRDLADELGPALALYDDGTEQAPWPALYDVGYVERGWVTMLAAPGSTWGYVRSVERTHKLTWPAAEAGAVVQCTAVEEIPKRVVKGTVAQEGEDRAILIGCGFNRQMKQDGAFESEVPVPCSIWAMGLLGTRVPPTLIEPGEGPAELEMLLEDDPLRGPTGGWIPAGIERLREVAGTEVAAMDAQVALIDELLTKHDAKTPVGRILGRWRLDRTALLEETRVAVKLFDDPRTQALAIEALNPPPPPAPEAEGPHGGGSP